MDRTAVKKTLKMYVNGKFIRSESGRVMELDTGKRKEFLANAPWASRKDLRDAVSAARKAFGKWSSATAYNRGQVLYRLAEMMEDRKEELSDAVQKQSGLSAKDSRSEVAASIDRVVWYAGWTDKFGAVYSSINPVAMPHLNFTSPIPSGVVAVHSPEAPSLLGMLSLALPSLVAGNAVVAVVPPKASYVACLFGELIHCSDLPAAVFNLLTGDHEELLPHCAKHMDLNCLVGSSSIPSELWKKALKESSGNLKRMRLYKILSKKDWFSDTKGQSPLYIIDSCEAKTVWHPVGQSIGGSSGY